MGVFHPIFHLYKISGNFGGNFHLVKNVFHLIQVRSPPSDCDFKKFKNVAVNSLEVVRPFKSCKWNTYFHRKVSNGKTGLPFQNFRLFRKFSSGTNQKRVFHLHPNRNFRNFLVTGKRHMLPHFTSPARKGQRSASKREKQNVWGVQSYPGA